MSTNSTRFIPWSWVDYVTITMSPGTHNEESTRSETTTEHSCVTTELPEPTTPIGPDPTTLTPDVTELTTTTTPIGPGPTTFSPGEPESTSLTDGETEPSTDIPDHTESTGSTAPSTDDTNRTEPTTPYPDITELTDPTEPSPAVTEHTTEEGKTTEPDTSTFFELEPDTDLPSTSAEPEPILEIFSSGSTESSNPENKPLSHGSFYPQNAAWEIDSIGTASTTTTPFTKPSTTIPTSTQPSTTTTTTKPSTPTTPTTTGGNPLEGTTTTITKEPTTATESIHAQKQSFEEELKKLLDHNTKLVDIIRATLQVQFTLFSRIISYILPNS